MSEHEEMRIKEALLKFLKGNFTFAGTKEQAYEASFDITCKLYDLVMELTNKK